MEFIEFIIYAVITAFVASAITFSLARRYNAENKKIKYVPAIAAVIVGLGFLFRTLTGQGTETFGFIVFFSVIAFVSSLTTALTVDKNSQVEDSE